MAAAAVPTGSESFYTALESQSSLFLNVDTNGTIGFNVSGFDVGGSNSSCTTFSTWSVDPYSTSCCSDESSFTPAPTFFPGLESSPAPTEDDMLMDAAWMQPPHQPDVVMHPTLVLPQSSFPQDHHKFRFQGSQFGDRVLLNELPHPDSSQLSSLTSDGSLTSSQEPTVGEDSDGGVEIKHEPPPLNMKRLEKEEPVEDNIEAAEVSVDLIQNRRPFRCGLEGCNKTFKNPQTMKMHHKTHYTDGSALTKDGVALLPTLTASAKAGQNKKIPSRCPKCRKTFVGLYELRRHYGRKHSEGEKPFACRKCDKKFYIEVDVRDHEKLCGEPIECKCGLKFAFKCNLVAHKKAHPACQDTAQVHQAAPQKPTSISYASCNQSTTSSDEDSSQSRGSSASPPVPRHSTKRPREEKPTSASTRSASKQTKYNSAYYTLTPPAPEFKGVPKVDYATSTFKAALYDFAGIQFSTQGSSLWSSNMHYPSVKFATSPSVPLPTSSTYTSVFGGLEQLGSQFYQMPQAQSDLRTRLELMDRAPLWNSVPGGIM